MCMHVRAFYLGKCQEQRLRKRHGEKKKHDPKFDFYNVSAIYLYDGQGVQREGLGPGSWEAQHHCPIGHASAPFPGAPAPLFPAQLLSEF